MPRLFLGNLGHDCRERDIERFFKGYGDLRHINIKGPYGFLELDDERDAEDAIKDLNGKSFNGGSRIRIEYANGNDRDGRGGGGGWDRRDGGRSRQISDGRFKRTNYRLVVKNLSSRTSWQDLKDFMRKAGDVTYTTVNRGVRGEGLVEFTDRDGMEYALRDLDDTKLDGNRIKLIEESKQGGRSRSRSDRRGRSRSRSRGRRGGDDAPRRGSRQRSRSPNDRNRRRSRTPDSKRRRRSGTEEEKRSRTPEERKMRSATPERRRSASPEKDRQRSESPEKRSRSRDRDERSRQRSGSRDMRENRRSGSRGDRSRSRSRSERNEGRDRYRSRSPRHGNESE